MTIDSLHPIPNTAAISESVPSYTFALGPHTPELAEELARPVRECDVVGLECIDIGGALKSVQLIQDLCTKFANPTVPALSKWDALRKIDPFNSDFRLPVSIHLARTGLRPVLLRIDAQDSAISSVYSAMGSEIVARLSTQHDASNDTLRAITEEALRKGTEEKKQVDESFAGQLLALAEPTHGKVPSHIGAILGTNHHGVPEIIHAAGYGVSGEYVGISKAPYNDVAYRQIKAGRLDPHLLDRIVLHNTFDVKNIFTPQGSQPSEYERHKSQETAQLHVSALSDAEVEGVLRQLDDIKSADRPNDAKQDEIIRLLRNTIGYASVKLAMS